MNLESMAHIYKAMLPHFVTLLEEANHYGVSLEVSVSPEGEITFTSHERKNDKVHYNVIKQGKDHVGESCFSYKLGNISIDKKGA